MRPLRAFAVLLAPTAALVVAAPASPTRIVVEQVRLPTIGKATVYRPESMDAVHGVVLFLSGDGGWNRGVVDMARRAADRSVVVGLSFPALRKAAERRPGQCWYPAGDLEEIAQAVQKTYHFPGYIRPILAGYSSGATAVFGALAQAPAGAFAGGISLGFCPDLEVARPLCPRGGWRPSYDARKRVSLLPPRPDLPARADGAPRWSLLQGRDDQVCSAVKAVAFAGPMPAARVILLPKVGHGFSVPRNWGDQYDHAVDELLAQSRPETAPPGEPSSSGTAILPEGLQRGLDSTGLPLVVRWPAGAGSVLIFISGDGGWAELDESVARALMRHGIAVVGWNALRYFWEPKPPARFLDDLSRVVAALPPDAALYAGGYSFGAEVIPTALVGAPETMLARITGLVLLAPGPYATFEVSPLDWLRSGESPTDRSVAPALTRLATRLDVLCVEPQQAGGTGCPAAPVPRIRTLALPGGHHFSGDFEALAAGIAAFIDTTAGQAPRSSGSSRE